MRLLSLAAAVSVIGAMVGGSAASAMPTSPISGPSLIEKAVVVKKTTVVRRPPPRVVVRKKVIVR